MLEQTALHAQVTFYLQQYHIPIQTIKLYFLPMNSLVVKSSYTITINYTTSVSALLFFIEDIDA